MKVLVIYYSQTGQLRSIIDQVFSDVKELRIDYCMIQPSQAFPFPWTARTFFDCMPESVLQIPEPIEPIPIPNTSYDLVVLGYTPWFLSPSIPITSFLKSDAAQVLSGKPVLTIIGARNMWLNAQEKVKQELIRLNARLVGNIALVDRNPNLTSVLTIMRWTFTGQKERSRFLPEAGVQQQDIKACSRFGPVIEAALKNQSLDHLHEHLLQLTSVDIKPGLVVLERRGIANFRKFAKLIASKGRRGEDARVPWLKLFHRILFVGVFFLSPISQLTAKLKTILHRKRLFQEVDYFESIEWKQDAL